VTDASGIATFTVKSTKAEVVTYTAAVTADAVTVAQTANVTFQPGAVNASVSTVAVSKASVGADGVDSATVTVTLKDANGNAVSGKNVTLAQASGSSTITPNSAVTTDSSGQAIFTVTSQKMEIVTYTATDSSDSIPITQTKQITFTAGAVNAAQSNVAVSKATVLADNSDSATVTVTLKDVNGNVISGKTVSLTQGSGSSTITATQAITDANGIATFTVKSTKAEAVIYTTVTGNVTLVLHPVSVTFTPGIADAAVSTITASKTSVSANATDSAVITVTVKDAYSNVVPGRSVELLQSTGSSLITSTPAITNTNGIASFVVTNSKKESVTYSAQIAADNVTLTRTVNVQFLSDNANLASLQLSAGVLIPIFTPAQTSYMASVPNDVYQLTFTPTAADSNATIRINGSTISSGTASIPISLQTGNNTVTIELIAADGQTRKTYTIQVMREPNKDARLQALAGSPVAISPAFDPAITQYTVNVANQVNQYSVQADVYNPLSTLTVTGAVYDSSTQNYVSNLQVGANTITLKVVAQDGQTESDYTITVIRADALTEVKDALNLLQIGYTGTDTWEFVTGNLQLPTVQNQLPVSWSSSQPQLVQADGTVIRPATAEGTVILTATIQHNGVAWSRTFIVIVKPQNVNIVKTEQTRTVPIRIGENSTDIQQTPITRKTLSDGATIDKVVANSAQLSSALQAAMSNNENSVHVVISDLPAAPADEVTADVPIAAYDSLAGKVNLNIDTDYASVILNKATLEQMKDDGQSLFFRFVPIRQTEQVSLLTKQALDDTQVQQVASNASVNQVGTPMTIETNYKSYTTTLLFPTSKLNMPASSSEQAAYVSTLYVYIQHSDGEIELQRGTPQYDSKGNLQGIAVQINKFSTFTILSVQPKRSTSNSGTNSGGGGATNSGSGQTTPSTPSNPVPSTTPGSSTAQPTGTHSAYIKGYPNGTFLPAKTTTRAEVAAMLWRIMQANGATATSTLRGYSDVPATHWAAEAIRELQAKQIMLGVTSDQFAPNRPLTRAEFATLAVRWQQLAPATSDLSTSFKDVNGHWALPSITTLMQTGVVKGYEDGTFRPNAGVTRAELVTMMNRLLKRGPLTGVTTATWKDVPATHWAFGDIEEASLTHTYTILSDGKEQWSGK
ncbi:Ig-like domain-containing protein, partial [Paenibacillus sp. SGZ-1009]|uniref:Ig-like domain-containing protein n=1 Tax=Paenibacillus campi TaxID=3106031 RepID=UPI002AFE56EB